MNKCCTNYEQVKLTFCPKEVCAKAGLHCCLRVCVCCLKNVAYTCRVTLRYVCNTR